MLPIKDRSSTPIAVAKRDFFLLSFILKALNLPFSWTIKFLTFLNKSFHWSIFNVSIIWASLYKSSNFPLFKSGLKFLKSILQSNNLLIDTIFTSTSFTSEIFLQISFLCFTSKPKILRTDIASLVYLYLLIFDSSSKNKPVFLLCPCNMNFSIFSLSWIVSWEKIIENNKGKINNFN